MKIIAQINDKTLLGKEGISSAEPRITARAVVQNAEGLYAVIYTEFFDCYTLPGGGVDAGEDIVDGLRREMLEEVGCTCDEIREIGEVHENRAFCDFTQIDHYFFVRTEHIGETHLTEWESENGTNLLWVSLEEMLSLVSSYDCDTERKKYFKARDMAALEEYMKLK